MVFVKSITRYLLRVSSLLEKRTERVATGRNCRGTNKGGTQKAKDRNRWTYSYQHRTLVKQPTKTDRKFIKRNFLDSNNSPLVNKFNLLLGYLRNVYVCDFFFEQTIVKTKLIKIDV